MSQRAILSAAMIFAAMGALTACSSSGAQESRAVNESEGGLFGMFGGGGNERAQEAAQGQIGVNSFLWRASLDTLNFMPLASEDPYGGVIITDWYTDPQRPAERFKATVYILDTRLRADALNVSIFREINQGGAWTAAAVDPATSIQIENAILTRARQLRLSTLGNN